MAIWDGTGDGTDTAYNQAVSLMGAGMMRFPGGSWGDIVDWSNLACGSHNWVNMTMQKAITFARATQTEIQAIVNYPGYWCDTNYGHTAAVSKAVSWVNYMNITGGGAMRCNYWEIGNETFGNWEQGYTSDDEAGGTTYGNNFVDFYNAMKAADPTIKVGALCQFDHEAFSQGVLQALKSKNCIPTSSSRTPIPCGCPGATPAAPPRGIRPCTPRTLTSTVGSSITPISPSPTRTR
jgi:hypothetical protein